MKSEEKSAEKMKRGGEGGEEEEGYSSTKDGEEEEEERASKISFTLDNKKTGCMLNRGRRNCQTCPTYTAWKARGKQTAQPNKHHTHAISTTNMAAPSANAPPAIA